MSEEINLSMMDDIVIPDEALETANTTDPVESPDPVDPVEPTVDPVEPAEPKKEEIDISLTDIDPDPIDAPDPKNANNEVYKTLAEALKEEGFFTGEDTVKDIKDLSTLADAFKSEMKKHELEDLNDTQKKVLEAFRAGVPAQDIIKHEETVNQFNTITPDLLRDNEELQKAIFLTDLIEKGLSESRANKLYEISYDNGDLFAEASASLEVLKQKEAETYNQRIEAAKAQETAKKEAIEKRQKAIKQSIYDVDKFLGDVAVTENLKSKVHRSMTEIVGYSEDGTPLNALMKARLEDPIDFETKLYYLYELTNGLTDIKKFSKQADSKAAKKLESLLNNNTFIKDNSTAAYKQDPNSYDADKIVELI